MSCVNNNKQYEYINAIYSNPTKIVKTMLFIEYIINKLYILINLAFLYFLRSYKIKKFLKIDAKVIKNKEERFMFRYNGRIETNNK